MINNGKLRIAHEDKENTFLSTEEGEQRFNCLCVYFDQNDIKDLPVTKFICNFDELVSMVINNPEKYQGIFVHTGNTGYILELCTLLMYKKNKLMLDSNDMSDLLKKLNKDEIKYLGQERYDVIYKVYLENKVPKDIAKEMNLSDEQVGNDLGQGYGRLRDVIWYNYSC